ncbi:MAG: hypothetical protein U0518_02460 [Candidatus Gracilibacteria bacterium]
MKTSGFLQSRGSLLLSTLLFTTLIVPLSTVGFVSLQGYTKDAKAATSREHISILTNEINQKGVSAIDMNALINTGSVDKTVQISSQKTIFGETNTEKLTTKAGDVQWTSLPSVDSTRMKDQYGNMPLIGYAATSQYSALQVATTINDQVYIKENFVPDSGENAAKGLIQNPSGTSELIHGDYGKHR